MDSGVTLELSEVNLRKYPFRGIITQIAKERGVTPQAVRMAKKNHSPAVMRRILELVEERRALMRQYEEVMGCR